ncbi:restriction endonuclease subunit S [uncultured Gilliamella sp.]|uniref:restriction endonuclease subunit S n=1 Tax=uncultured Gilliamella sp. TaxID=1193505 RepID=UPI002600D2AF|nr:restriction endonuclease subunit S [uncultured Gilliamella sp.]
MLNIVLPETWIFCELSNIAHVVTGKTPSKKNKENFDGHIPFIKPGDLGSSTYIKSTEEKLSEKGLKLVPSLPKNSILVSCIGTLGKVGITTAIISATNQQINAVLVDTNIDLKYLYYQLITIKDWLKKESSATTIPIINKSKFEKTPIIIPPLSEQKIIAEKLDLLLAEAQETKSRLEQIPELLKQFRQSVLSDAVSGKLTEDCTYHSRSNNIILGNVLELAYGKSLPAKFRSGDGYPVYGSNGEIGKHKQKLVNGPFIIVGRKGSYGEITWSDSSGWPIDTTYYVVLKIKSNLKFIFYLLQTLGLNQLNRSTAIPGLNREDAYKLKINLPSIQEQNEIVRRVEQLFAYADKIEQQVNTALEKVNHLPQSILAKAFRGELTAQWRAENVDLITGENSAASLLEKIQVERAQNNKNKKKK